MGFFRQDYWSRLPFLPPGDLPDPGTEPVAVQWLGLYAFTAGAPGSIRGQGTKIPKFWNFEILPFIPYQNIKFLGINILALLELLMLSLIH